MTATLILPVGPPGCGKSTLAGRLYRHDVFDRAAIVSPDDYRRVLTGDRADQSENRQVFSICHQIAKVRLHRGLKVYFDATNYTSLNELSTIAGYTSAQIVCIRFSLDRSTVHVRNLERDNPVPRDIVDRMYDEFMAVRLATYPGITITPDEALEWARQGWWK